MAKPAPVADDILARLKFIRTKKQEYFVCFSLDSNGQVITRRVVSIGTLTGSLVHPREVFAGALKDRAAAIIVAHNHPSGDPTSSAADIRVTQQLLGAGQILGIAVHDHVIVARIGYCSFREGGLLAKLHQSLGQEALAKSRITPNSNNLTAASRYDRTGTGAWW